jgi:tetratricopeptide (TPR) repeat protein
MPPAVSARTFVVGVLLISSAVAIEVHLGASQAAADPRDARILRVEQWLKATLHHTPGESDEAAALVGSWSYDDLRALWTDASVLVALMRQTNLKHVVARAVGQTDGEKLRYTEPQLRHLRALACAASGKATWIGIVPNIVTDPACVPALIELDSELRQLSERAGASKRQGDQNFFLRRAAMLHADIAVAPQAVARRVDIAPGEKVASGPAGPQQIRLDISDGRGTRLHQVPIHWMIGRLLLDEVRLPGAREPAPGRDEMVRQWYRASLAWMQSREDYDTVHVARARRLFSADPDILFLSGCQHETFAAPRIQRATQTAKVPAGFALGVASDRQELLDAEGLFRRVLELKPDAVEARLRLGHVLLRLERFQEAAGELRQAVRLLESDEQLLYDGELFLGAAEEALGNYDASRVAFERAASLYPTAQSPRLSLSELARRRGDRAGALRELWEVFALPAGESERNDPWWKYQFAQARNADQLLDDLRRLFRPEVQP